MYITLEEAKKHLNIDTDFTDDDNYILQLIQVAEIVVEKHIDCELTAQMNETGKLSYPLIQAMLLLIGNMYANRENVTVTNMTELPLAYNYILDLYKDYQNKHSVGGIF